MTEPDDLESELKRISDTEIVVERLAALELKLDRALEEIRHQIVKLSRGLGVY